MIIWSYFEHISRIIWTSTQLSRAIKA